MARKTTQQSTSTAEDPTAPRPRMRCIIVPGATAGTPPTIACGFDADEATLRRYSAGALSGATPTDTQQLGGVEITGTLTAGTTQTTASTTTAQPVDKGDDDAPDDEDDADDDEGGPDDDGTQGVNDHPMAKSKVPRRSKN